MMNLDGHIQDITWQATRKLCGKLDSAEAMTDFFLYLREIIPLHHIIMGKFFETPPELHILFLTDERGTFRIDRRYPFSAVQRELAEKYSFFNPQHTGSELIDDENHPLAPLYTCLRDELETLPSYPLFCYRVTDRREFYGGLSLIFKPGTEVTSEIINILNLLEAPLRIFVNAAFQYEELSRIRNSISRENTVLRRRLVGLDGVSLVGVSGGLRMLMEQVRQVAPLNVSILIRGETGTGKELVAKTVHHLSGRAAGPFVAVNCGAIPPELIDSELFGHVKGAFTGALNERKGRFEQANGGTLFLDEVAELPLNMQARLLRVLQERTVDKVGGRNPVPVDFRLIAATHRPLEKMVGEGSFREDLYYRLNVVSLEVPPLRRRLQDIPVLVRHFLELAANRFGVAIPAVPEEEMDRLMHYEWPGNVRQLQNVVEEGLALYRHGRLHFQAGNVTQTFSSAPEEEKPFPFFHDMARAYLEQALRLCGGKISGPGGAAELTGLNYGTLKGKLDKYGIPHGRNTRHADDTRL